MKHFKWYDANGEKPEQGVRVLLKIQGEESPVVGYWEGGYWEVCTDNLYIEQPSWSIEGTMGFSIEPEFYDSEVVAYMYIDMDSR